MSAGDGEGTPPPVPTKTMLCACVVSLSNEATVPALARAFAFGALLQQRHKRLSNANIAHEVDVHLIAEHDRKHSQTQARKHAKPERGQRHVFEGTSVSHASAVDH